jgi:hypothetical protein
MTIATSLSSASRWPRYRLAISLQAGAGGGTASSLTLLGRSEWQDAHPLFSARRFIRSS